MAAPCPFNDRAEFSDNAKPMQVQIDGQPAAVIVPKDFRSGSVGWHAATRYVAMVGDKPVQVQLNVVATVIGTKNLPDASEVIAAKKKHDEEYAASQKAKQTKRKAKQ